MARHACPYCHGVPGYRECSDCSGSGFVETRHTHRPLGEERESKRILAAPEPIHAQARISLPDCPTCDGCMHDFGRQPMRSVFTLFLRETEIQLCQDCVRAMLPVARNYVLFQQTPEPAFKVLKTLWGLPVDVPPPAEFPPGIQTDTLLPVLKSLKEQNNHGFALPVFLHAAWFERFPELNGHPEVARIFQL